MVSKKCLSLQLQTCKTTNYITIIKRTVMSSKFVIGNREKNEWISVLDTDKKELEFISVLASAKEYQQEEDAQYDLSEIQNTGYFRDLQIYIKEDNKAYRIDEHDSFM